MRINDISLEFDGLPFVSRIDELRDAARTYPALLREGLHQQRNDTCSERRGFDNQGKLAHKSIAEQ